MVGMERYISSLYNSTVSLPRLVLCAGPYSYQDRSSGQADIYPASQPAGSTGRMLSATKSGFLDR